MRTEQTEILKYIIHKKAYHRIKGRELWKEMEKDGICGGARTWQSMKENFRKQIMPQISTFPLLPRRIARIKKAFHGKTVQSFSSSEESGQEENRDVDYANTTSYTANTYTLMEDQTILDYISNTCRYSQVNGNALWKLMEDRNLLDGRTWQSMKERFRKRIIHRLERYKLSSQNLERFQKVQREMAPL